MKHYFYVLPLLIMLLLSPASIHARKFSINATTLPDAPYHPFKASQGGFSLIISGGKRVSHFLNSTYYLGKESGTIKPGSGFSVGFSTMLRAPLELEARCFKTDFKLNQNTEIADSSLRHLGLEVSLNAYVLPWLGSISSYFFPYLGVGYQTSSIGGGKIEESFNLMYSKGVGSPFWKAGSRIMLGGFTLFGEYKQTVFGKHAFRAIDFGIGINV